MFCLTTCLSNGASQNKHGLKPSFPFELLLSVILLWSSRFSGKRLGRIIISESWKTWGSALLAIWFWTITGMRQKYFVPCSSQYPIKNKWKVGHLIVLEVFSASSSVGLGKETVLVYSRTSLRLEKNLGKADPSTSLWERWCPGKGLFGESSSFTFGDLLYATHCLLILTLCIVCMLAVFQTSCPGTEVSPRANYLHEYFLNSLDSMCLEMLRRLGR